MQTKKPIILIICDGLGHREEKEHNAVFEAATPNLDKYWAEYPHAILEAAGEAVGLPDGQMGTSEANHLVIGSGRIIYQNLVKINHAVKSGEMAKNKAIVEAFEHVKKYDSVLHIKVLASPGGVHGHVDHAKFLLKAARDHGVKKAMLHLFTDGRDTPPQSALAYVEDIEKYLREIGFGKIATVGGRYWGMDRDNNDDRIEKHFAVMVGKNTEGRGTSNEEDKGNANDENGGAKTFKSAKEAIEHSYSKGVTDEFVDPSFIEMDEGEVGCVQANDAVIFTNFRADRGKQLANRFVKEKISNLHYVAMTKYDDGLDVRVAFPPEEITNTLSDILSANHYKQLRITETDKFTHMTFFFNAQRDEPDPSEDRIKIESNKDVATHDKKPEMKALVIAEKIAEAIAQKKYDFIAANIVNCDIVGHTGVVEAIKKAVSTVDEALKIIVDAAQAGGADVIITADHGNAEQTFDLKSNQPHTAHTINPVPFILISKDYKKLTSEKGLLSDMAPTILKMFGLEIPKEMTGKSLV